MTSATIKAIAAQALIDHPDMAVILAAPRFPNTARYGVALWDNGTAEHLLSTDDWAEVLALIAARAAATASA